MCPWAVSATGPGGIDETVLRQLAADISADDLRTVITMFGRDMTRLCDALEVAVRTNDAKSFHRAAHAIAGAAGAVAAATLETAARAAMAAGHNPASMAAGAADITARAADAQAALTHYLTHGELPA